MMETALPEALGNAAIQPDRRGGQRYTLILRAGKLVCPLGEFLCVLRDVSNKGLKARLFHPLPPADRFELELGGGERFAVEPVWSRGRDAGFRFAGGPIDVHTLLAEAGPFPKRHIRLRIARELPVRLQVGAEALAGRVIDISQHGAQVDLPSVLPLGQKLRFEAGGFPVLQGRVRWRRGKCHGLVFQQGFRLDALAALVAGLQLPTSGPAIGTRTG